MIARGAHLPGWCAKSASLLRRFVFAAYALCAASAVWGQAAETLVFSGGETNINSRTTHWVDTTGIATPELAKQQLEVAALAGNPTPQAIRLPNNQALWQKFVWRPLHDQTAVYLRTNVPAIDYISVYWQDSDRRWQAQHSGDKIPHDLWPQTDRSPIFKLAFSEPSFDPKIQAANPSPPPGQTVFVRIAYDHVPVTVQLTLIDEPSLRASLELESLLIGGYFGLVTLVLVFSAYQAWRFSDVAYALYATLTACMLFMQLALTGVGTNLFWSNSPVFANLASFVVIEVYTLLGLAVIHELLGFRRRNLRASYLLQGVVVLGCCIAIAHVFWHNNFMFMVSNFYAQAGMVFAVFFTIWAHRLGDRYALWILLGFAPIIITAIPPMLRNLGLLPANFVTQYGLMLGAAGEIMILFFVLNMRSRESRDTLIRERALSSQDPLTGLTDQTVFKARFYQAMVRSRRYRHRCTVLRAELENYEWFATEHGQETAERALVLTAAAMRKVTRDVDLLSRVDTREFVLLVEGPCTHATAAKAAAQLLAFSLHPSDALPIGSGLKLLISIALLPDPGEAYAVGDPEESLDWMREQSAAQLRTPNQSIVSLNF